MAHPEVQRITLRAVATEVDQSQSVNITCAVMMDIARGREVVRTISFSPFSTASELEEALNGFKEIDALGRVAVQKQGYEGSEVGFWFSDIAVEFTVVFLTRLGVSLNDIVTLNFNSEQVSCVDAISVQLGLTVGMETIQEPSYPASFDVGFDINSQLQRLTEPLPLDTSPEMLRGELTELLSWGCEEEEVLEEKTLLYEGFESSGRGRARDNSTSFCGSYSERNPGQVWRTSDESFRITEFPYVSYS